jgi:hypothetical protein
LRLPLIFIGDDFPNENFEHGYPAEDVPTGAPVMVRASREAVDDYGEAAVKDKASDKYDRIDKPATVTVTTSDFL